MITPEQYQRIARVLPFLQHAEAPLVREFQQSAFFARIPAGQDVFVEGDRTEAIALLFRVLCGCIKSARRAARLPCTASAAANPAF